MIKAVAGIQLFDWILLDASVRWHDGNEAGQAVIRATRLEEVAAKK